MCHKRGSDVGSSHNGDLLAADQLVSCGFRMAQSGGHRGAPDPRQSRSPPLYDPRSRWKNAEVSSPFAEEQLVRDWRCSLSLPQRCLGAIGVLDQPLDAAPGRRQSRAVESLPLQRQVYAHSPRRAVLKSSVLPLAWQSSQFMMLSPSHSCELQSSVSKLSSL